MRPQGRGEAPQHKRLNAIVLVAHGGGISTLPTRTRPRERHEWIPGTIDFINMADGTREEYELLDRHYRRFTEGLPRALDDPSLAALRRPHGLQDRPLPALCCRPRPAPSATGADEEMVVSALLHDIGDTISPENHSELGASVLQPYVAAPRPIGSSSITRCSRAITTSITLVATATRASASAGIRMFEPLRGILLPLGPELLRSGL